MCQITFLRLGTRLQFHCICIGCASSHVPHQSRGLEIKTKVTISWKVGHKDKFMLPKSYIGKWYDIQASLKKDDSEAILKRIHDVEGEEEEEQKVDEEEFAIEMIDDELGLPIQH